MAYSRWGLTNALFSALKFLQGKNKYRTVVGHIKELLGLLEFHLSVGHSEFFRRLGSSWAAMFHAVGFSIVQFLFLPSSCEISLRKPFKKTPGKCRTSWVCDQMPERKSLMAAKFKGRVKLRFIPATDALEQIHSFSKWAGLQPQSWLCFECSIYCVRIQHFANFLTNTDELNLFPRL